MHGDTHGQEPEYDDNIQPETPASVVFMEMMRRAAANRDSDQPDDDTGDTGRQPVVEPSATAGMSPEERRKAAALEAERVQRVQRRKEIGRAHV